MSSSIRMLENVGPFKKGDTYAVVSENPAGWIAKANNGMNLFVNHSLAEELTEESNNCANTRVSTGYVCADPFSALEELKNFVASSQDSAPKQAPVPESIEKDSGVNKEKSTPPLPIAKPKTPTMPKSVLVSEESGKGTSTHTPKEKCKEGAKTETVEPIAKQSFKISELAFSWTGKLPDLEVPVFDDSTWCGAGLKLIPKLLPNFVWTETALFSLACTTLFNDKTFLVGPPGVGKTVQCKQWCALINQPHVDFNGKADMEGSSLLGQAWAHGMEEGMKWYDGLYTEGVRKGWWITLNEIMKIPSGVMMNIQGAMERGGVVILDEYPGELVDKVVKTHENCRVCMTDNTKGLGDDMDKYGAGQVQDVSFLDRLDHTVNVDFLPKQQEAELVAAETGIKISVAMKIVSVASLIRKEESVGNLSLAISVRGLCNIARKSKLGVKLSTAFELCYINKLSDEQEISIAQGFLTTLIGV